MESGDNEKLGSICYTFQLDIHMQNMSSSSLWQQNRSKHVCFYKKQYLFPILDHFALYKPSELYRYRNNSSELIEIIDWQNRSLMNCTFADKTKVLCNYFEGPDYIIVWSSFCEQNHTFLALASVLEKHECFRLIKDQTMNRTDTENECSILQKCYDSDIEEEKAHTITGPSLKRINQGFDNILKNTSESKGLVIYISTNSTSNLTMEKTTDNFNSQTSIEFKKTKIHTVSHFEDHSHYKIQNNSSSSKIELATNTNKTNISTTRNSSLEFIHDLNNISSVFAKNVSSEPIQEQIIHISYMHSTYTAKDKRDVIESFSMSFFFFSVSSFILRKVYSGCTKNSKKHKSRNRDSMDPSQFEHVIIPHGTADSPPGTASKLKGRYFDRKDMDQAMFYHDPVTNQGSHFKVEHIVDLKDAPPSPPGTASKHKGGYTGTELDPTFFYHVPIQK